MRNGSIAFWILAMIVVGMSCVHAIRESIVNDQGYIVAYPDNPDMAGDYMLHYAVMYPESDIVNSKILVTDYDITYARNQLQSVEQMCVERDGGSNGPWCETANNYRNAIPKLVNARAQQTGAQPASSSPNIPFITPIMNTITTAFAQLLSWLKGVFGS